MKRFRRYSVALAFAACCVLICPAFPAMAAPGGVQQVRQGTDIVIENGVLRGCFLDANGQPVVGASVIVSKNGQVVARATTLSNGAYRVAGLSEGSHTIKFSDGEFPVRLWSKEAAPASAKAQFTVARTAVRGQFVDELGYPIWGNIAIGVVAASALTVAIVNTAKLSDINDNLDNLQSP